MVRKAAVFCLVAVHNIAGADIVSPYFDNLAGSKVNILHTVVSFIYRSSVPYLPRAVLPTELTTVLLPIT